MARYFWKETGVFPGMKNGDPVHLDYDLWQDICTLDEVIEFERALQIKNGVFAVDE